MPRYCLDTSGIANPLGIMPEDIYSSLWQNIRNLIEDGCFCCNKEIADELGHVEGAVGLCLSQHIASMTYEVGQGSWDWPSYIGHVNRMKIVHARFISEYNGNRKDTIGVNDLSIVALAKTLTLPVVSMEAHDRGQISAKKMRIPRLCLNEGVEHLDFNELLRRESITL